ncbi:uncharacterized protein [Chamaea fasciata]|uniref:uncharacterized protein isoform X2 n=1 Tax=Chamaea fasciata TaxID=190680 RepID=UPI00336AB6EB
MVLIYQLETHDLKVEYWMHIKQLKHATIRFYITRHYKVELKRRWENRKESQNGREKEGNPKMGHKLNGNSGGHLVPPLCSNRVPHVTTTKSLAPSSWQPPFKYLEELDLHVSLVLRSPELDTALLMWPHQG